MVLSFVADENVETEVVATLRRLGYDVSHAVDTGPGQADESLLGTALVGAFLVIGSRTMRLRRVPSP